MELLGYDATHALKLEGEVCEEMKKKNDLSRMSLLKDYYLDIDSCTPSTSTFGDL